MTRLTGTDILIRVQRQFGDESGVQVTQDDVLRWVNDAQREAVTQSDVLLQGSSAVDSVTNQSVYEYVMTTPAYQPLSEMSSVQAVHYRDSDTDDGTYYALQYLNSKQMDIYFDGWATRATPIMNPANIGLPQFFTRNNPGQIFIYPAPYIGRHNGVRITYNGAPYDQTVLSSIPGVAASSLPVEYDLYILEYCLMKAYELDEDWEAVAKKASYVQSTLDYLNGKIAWFAQQTYPFITDTES